MLFQKGSLTPFKISYNATPGLEHSLYLHATKRLSKPTVLSVQRSEMIGEGGFGKVKLAIDADNNQLAIKNSKALSKD